jgi:hypothetical protein
MYDTGSVPGCAGAGAARDALEQRWAAQSTEMPAMFWAQSAHTEEAWYLNVVEITSDPRGLQKVACSYRESPWLHLMLPHHFDGSFEAGVSSQR